jgi:hypothetical protein
LPVFFVSADCQSTLPAALIQAKYSKLFWRRLRLNHAELKIALFYGGEKRFFTGFLATDGRKPHSEFLVM